jgi:hypothetical protein
MNKEEIDILIGVLQSVITVAEKINPNLQTNKVIIAVNKGIAVLQGLGL